MLDSFYDSNDILVLLIFFYNDLEIQEFWVWDLYNLYM